MRRISATDKTVTERIRVGPAKTRPRSFQYGDSANASEPIINSVAPTDAASNTGTSRRMIGFARSLIGGAAASLNGATNTEINARAGVTNPGNNRAPLVPSRSPNPFHSREG